MPSHSLTDADYRNMSDDLSFKWLLNDITDSETVINAIRDELNV